MRPVVRVVNCASVSVPESRAAHIFETALTKAGPYGEPVIVLAMECADFLADNLADDLGWEAIQRGTKGSPESAVVIAYNRDRVRLVGKPRLIATSPAGDGVRTRYTVRARLNVDGHSQIFNVGHAPPDRSEEPQRRWYARSKTLDGIFGADFNDRPDFLADRYKRRVCGVRGQVLALLVPQRIASGSARGVAVGSDHLAIDVPLFTNTKENR